MEELIPFAKEMLSQRPSRGLLKVYLVGSVFALLGTVIGLVETVCHPFSSGETLDADMAFMLTQKRRPAEVQLQHQDEEREEKEIVEEEKLALKNEDKAQTMTLSKPRTFSQRSSANRLHAS